MPIKKRMRKWPFVLGIIIILAVVAVFVLLPRLMPSGGGANTTAILSTQATKGSVSTTISGSGTLANASVDIDLPFDVSAYRVYVKPGDRVQKGDVVAQISRASVSTAISTVKTLIYNLKYDQARIENKGVLERTIESNQALLDQLNSLYSDYYLYAPVDGTVAAVNIAEGTGLTAPADSNKTSGAAMTITPVDKMNVSVSVDETDILTVQPGQTANIECDALAGQTFTGTVVSVSDSADSSSGYATYTATIEVEKAEGMITGLSAAVIINKETHENVLLIPMTALQQYGNQSFVYTSASEDGILGGQTVVTTGLSDGAFVELTGGLTEGQMVYFIQDTSDSSMMFGNSMGFSGPGVSFGDDGGGPVRGYEIRSTSPGGAGGNLTGPVGPGGSSGGSGGSGSSSGGSGSGSGSGSGGSALSSPPSN